MEQIQKLTRETLIPISLVLTIIAGTWFLSAMNSRIDQNSLDIEIIRNSCADNPSRVEFDIMQSDIAEIKLDIKTLITQ